MNDVCPSVLRLITCPSFLCVYFSSLIYSCWSCFASLCDKWPASFLSLHNIFSHRRCVAMDIGFHSWRIRLRMAVIQLAEERRLRREFWCAQHLSIKARAHHRRFLQAKCLDCPSYWLDSQTVYFPYVFTRKLSSLDRLCGCRPLFFPPDRRSSSEANGG